MYASLGHILNWVLNPKEKESQKGLLPKTRNVEPVIENVNENKYVPPEPITERGKTESIRPLIASPGRRALEESTL